MNRRFMGNAISMPRTAITAHQTSSCHQGTIRPVTSMYAAMLEVSGTIMWPAAVAIDWAQLFSRMVMSLATPLWERTRKTAKAVITEVMPTPMAIPVFAPM